jgi:hypothetical protein
MAKRLLAGLALAAGLLGCGDGGERHLPRASKPDPDAPTALPPQPANGPQLALPPEPGKPPNIPMPPKR